MNTDPLMGKSSGKVSTTSTGTVDTTRKMGNWRRLGVWWSGVSGQRAIWIRNWATDPRRGKFIRLWADLVLVMGNLMAILCRVLCAFGIVRGRDWRAGKPRIISAAGKYSIVFVCGNCHFAARDPCRSVGVTIGLNLLFDHRCSRGYHCRIRLPGCCSILNFGIRRKWKHLLFLMVFIMGASFLRRYFWQNPTWHPSLADLFHRCPTARPYILPSELSAPRAMLHRYLQPIGKRANSKIESG